MTETVKVTYSQDWTAYNTAQTNEKAMFQKPLYDQCDGVNQAKQAKEGRCLLIGYVVDHSFCEILLRLLRPRLRMCVVKTRFISTRKAHGRTH